MLCPRNDYIGIVFCLSVDLVDAVDLAGGISIAVDRSGLPPHITFSITHVNANMVIAGRVAQAADAAAIGGIDAPDNIALLQHTTAEHFGFVAELVIVDVILGDKVVPSAAVAAAPAFSGKSLRIESVGIRHPLPVSVMLCPLPLARLLAMMCQTKPVQFVPPDAPILYW